MAKFSPEDQKLQRYVDSQGLVYVPVEITEEDDPWIEYQCLSTGQLHRSRLAAFRYNFRPQLTQTT